MSKLCPLSLYIPSFLARRTLAAGVTPPQPSTTKAPSHAEILATRPALPIAAEDIGTAVQAHFRCFRESWNHLSWKRPNLA